MNPRGNKARPGQAGRSAKAEEAPELDPGSPGVRAFFAQGAALCYSLAGQTRLVWGRVTPTHSLNPWFRFHFLQASLLHFGFCALYSLLGGILAYSLLFEPGAGGAYYAAAGLGLALAIQVLVFVYLGGRARRGHTPYVPLLGDWAADLAVTPVPLEIFKL